MAQLCISCAVLLASCASGPGGSWSRPVDYASYDKPLEKQVTDRIKAKVLERLGEGKNTRDRYFMIPFAYENKGRDPEQSHSFISVIRVLADDKQPKLNPELLRGRHQGRDYEAFTISWMPRDYPEKPELCAIKGTGGLLFPCLNSCELSAGKSFDLPTTLKLAVDAEVAVGMWGPYEITETGFDLGVRRLRKLESGELKYRADDRGFRKKKIAINCFHAMASLDEEFPAGGFLNTGYKMWGLNGTRQVLREYKTRPNYRAQLLEPVDIRNDLYGFVFTPEREGTKAYNPFKHASAYKKDGSSPGNRASVRPKLPRQVPVS